MFAKIFYPAISLATLLASPLAAQNGMPWCERAGASSIQGAYALIDQGDAILNRLSDCAQVNLMACEQALGYYQAAEQQVSQVFFDAKGEACTYCDITQIRDVASELAIRGDQFNQALQWDVDLRGVWNDYQTWKDAPYCAAPANAPPLPTAPAPLPSGCTFVDETPGFNLPDSDGPVLQGISTEQCRGICDANDWCRSFTVNRAAQACQRDNFTLPECVTACENEPTCTGYDYNIATARCVIRSETLAQDGLESIVGWTHYECN